MPFTISKTFDYGSANPILARLVLQVHEIVECCDVESEVSEGILDLCMKYLAPELLRCWEIRDRYEAEFQRQIEFCKNQVPNPQMIKLPCITTLDQECHNFLYEAKNFLRDLMQLFNFLYGTKFAPDVDRIITYRNAIEHPKGYAGPLEIRNFELKDGEVTEPCWWLRKDPKRKTASHTRRFSPYHCDSAHSCGVHFRVVG
jgi:hypothetical protein